MFVWEICRIPAVIVEEILIDKKPLTVKLAMKFEKELDIPAHVFMRIEKITCI